MKCYLWQTYYLLLLLNLVSCHLKQKDFVRTNKNTSCKMFTCDSLVLYIEIREQDKDKNPRFADIRLSLPIKKDSLGSYRLISPKHQIGHEYPIASQQIICDLNSAYGLKFMGTVASVWAENYSNSMVIRLATNYFYASEYDKYAYLYKDSLAKKNHTYISSKVYGHDMDVILNYPIRRDSLIRKINLNYLDELSSEGRTLQIKESGNWLEWKEIPNEDWNIKYWNEIKTKNNI